MKKPKRVLLIIAVLLIVIILILFNPMTPKGALRIACVKEGYIISALVMQTVNIKDLGYHTSVYHMNSDQCILKITFGAPYERVTYTSLELWLITKHRFWYSAKYYGAV